MKLDEILNNINIESLNIKDLYLLLKIINELDNNKDEIEVL